MRHRSLVLGALLALPAVFAMAKPNAILIPIASSADIIWNAVATDQDRIFVAGPRWTGGKGPTVAVFDRKGHPQPYPNSAWNSWTPGADAGRAFVSVNALHRDDHSGLWVIDTGAPTFGGDAVPGGAKAIRFKLTTNRVDRVYPLGREVVLSGSYIDDIRFHGDHAYLTDAGRPGLIVLDLKTGATRRMLDSAPAATAPPDRPIVVDGKVLKAPDGSPLRVNTDPLEVSPDGRWFYFAPLEGPWSRIETRWLDDPSIAPEVLATKVEPWADLPPTGSTAMDGNGDLYFSDVAEDSLKRRTPDGAITTVIRDPRLHWVDAPFIDSNHSIWLPVPQLDRIALFNSGKSQIQWPVQLFRLDLGPAAR